MSSHDQNKPSIDWLVQFCVNAMHRTFPPVLIFYADFAFLMSSAKTCHFHMHSCPMPKLQHTRETTSSCTIGEMIDLRSKAFSAGAALKVVVNSAVAVAVIARVSEAGRIIALEDDIKTEGAALAIIAVSLAVAGSVRNTVAAVGEHEKASESIWRPNQRDRK